MAMQYMDMDKEQRSVHPSARGSNVRFRCDYVCFTPESGRKSRWVITAGFDPKQTFGSRTHAHKDLPVTPGLRLPEYSQNTPRED